MNKQYAENEGQNKSLKAMSVLIVWLPWRKLHVPVLERYPFSEIDAISHMKCPCLQSTAATK